MNPLKKIIIASVTAFLIAGTAMAQWAVKDVPTKHHLNAIALIDETSGWIVGNKGTLLYRSGDSWKESPGVTNEKLNSVCLFSKDEGWAVGAHGTILQLKDAQWQIVESPTHQDLHTVSFSSMDEGYAVGNNGTFLWYKNGVWEIAEIQTPWHFYAITIHDDTPMIAGGRESLNVPIMDIVPDDSYNMVKLFYPGYVEISGLASPGDGIVWAVGKPGTILRKDASLWQKIEIEGKLPSLTSIFFADQDNGITVGHAGTIMTYSSSQWHLEESPVNVKLNGSCIAGNKYFAVGNNGTLLELTRNQIPDQDEVASTSQTIISTYPNPSSGILNIVIPETTYKGIVIISNTMGQVVFMKELDGELAGTTEQISTAGLGNGLYFVNISMGGEFTASGKFIVQH